MTIYGAFAKAGILDIDDVQAESLTLNTWIVLTSWVRFLCTTRESAVSLEQGAIRRGVYQVLMLEAGYVTAQARDEFAVLCAEFFVPLSKVLE